MNRHQYLQAVIRLYLDQPNTPTKARPRDWAIATTFYQQRIPLETLAHAVRIATLRRHLRPSEDGPLEPIHSLAYFREVLRSLTPDALIPGYVQYVTERYRELLQQLYQQVPLSTSKKPKCRTST